MLGASLLFAVGIVGLLMVVLFYPLALWVANRRVESQQAPSEPVEWPTVVMITAARNAASLLEAKIKSFQHFDYPRDRLLLVIASDASTDATRSIVEAQEDPRIRLVEQDERHGKASILNRAVTQVDAELLLFSDADALLAPDAVKKMVRHFSNERVGGVCGLRVSARDAVRLRHAQQTYIHLDSAIKRMESTFGRITSNDGKIHMIRRALFSSIPSDVTDDLYSALSVIAQGFLFLFEPEARAEVRVPSRDARHEINRRRRIVTRSLTGIFRMRRVLNPFCYGWFSVGLFINKVLRRLLPFFKLSVVAGMVWFLLISPIAREFVMSCEWGLVALVFGGLIAWVAHCDRLNKFIFLVGYMLSGIVGTGVGVIDFILGRRVSVWDAQKTEESQS